MELPRTVETPIVCNAIEGAQGKRGFDAFMRGRMLCCAAAEPAVVIRARRMAYHQLTAEARKSAHAVVEDADAPDCTGAFSGEINTTIHKGFGLSGRWPIVRVCTLWQQVKKHLLASWWVMLCRQIRS